MMQFPAHKCGLFLSHNEHKGYYQAIERYIEEQDLSDDFADAGAMQKSIDTDEIWILHWYPNTPIGSLKVAAPTLEEVLKMANETVTA